MPRAREDDSTDPTSALSENQRLARDATIAGVLVGIAVVFGIGTHWIAGDDFLRRGADGHSLASLVTSDVRWAAVLAASAAAPVLFLLWRRFARDWISTIGTVVAGTAAAGTTLCVATAASIDGPAWEPMRGSFPLLIASGVLSATAFCVAPPPRGRPSVDALRARAAVVRSRRATLTPERQRERLALLTSIAVGLATAFGVAPLWLLDMRFLSLTWYYGSYSLRYVVAHDAMWALAGAATTFAPVWYWAWRRWRVPGGGSIGAVIAAIGVAATLFGLDAGRVHAMLPNRWWGDCDASIAGGSFGLLLAAGIVYVIAFLAAPHLEPAPTRRVQRSETVSPAAAYWLLSGGVYVLIVLACSEARLVGGDYGWNSRGTSPSTLVALVQEDAAWAAGVGTLAFAPVLHFIWRKTAIPFGRVCGVATCAAGGLDLWMKLVDASTSQTKYVYDAAWLLPLVAVAFVIAFATAPKPRDREAVDDAEMSRLLRRHRAQFRPR